MHESGSKVEVYQIQEQDINEIERKMKDKNLKAIPGTIKIHQLTTEQSEEVKHRQISCVCYDKFCNVHELCSFKIPSGSEKSKQSCSKESKQSSTQDSYQDSRGKSGTNGRHQTEKHITDAAMSSFEDDNEVRRRVGKYRSFLKSLQKCKTFEELKSMCADIYGQIDEVKGSERSSRCYSVDYMSETYLPRSLSERGDAPIKVRANGDCLPACGSVFVFGNDRPST